MPGGFLNADELRALGLRSLGDDVCIDRAVSLYGATRISIGSHVRIDNGAILSGGEGGLIVGDHVHIAARVFMSGAARIELGDFSGVSVGTSIFSSNDDYRDGWLTGPTVPDDLRQVTSAPVVVGRHAVVGAGCVILPGMTIGDGASIGALTVVRKDVPPLAIVAGSPAQVIGQRADRMTELERQVRERER